MIKIANAQLWVHDQDEALAFYTEKVGMEVRADVTLPEMGNFRWLTVGPPGQPDFAIVLMAIPGPPVMDAETAEQVRDADGQGLRRHGVPRQPTTAGPPTRSSRARGVEFVRSPRCARTGSTPGSATLGQSSGSLRSPRSRWPDVALGDLDRQGERAARIAPPQRRDHQTHDRPQAAAGPEGVGPTNVGSLGSAGGGREPPRALRAGGEPAHCAAEGQAVGEVGGVHDRGELLAHLAAVGELDGARGSDGIPAPSLAVDRDDRRQRTVAGEDPRQLDRRDRVEGRGEVDTRPCRDGDGDPTQPGAAAGATVPNA